MLSFISGAPGSGKSKELMERALNDIQAGKKVLVIVPDPMMLSSERELTSVFGASKHNLDYEVTGFRRLSNIVFRSCGGLCYNYLDKGGCAIMMWRILSELSTELQTFKPGACTDIGLVSSMVSLFDIFADHGIDPESFEDAVYSLPSDLIPRAEDIFTVYTRYHELIHNGFDSTKDDLYKAAAMIRENGLYSDTSIYIDSFTGFDPCQYDVIDALMQVSGDITVTLSRDQSRDDEIFEKINKTEKKLSDIATRHNVSISKIDLAYENTAPEFRFFEKYCFDSYSNQVYTDTPQGISLVEANDIYKECELVCADIIKQIKQGTRFRELSIVMGNPTAYKGILDTVLSRHKIPYHFSVKDDVLQLPLFKHIICALNIITYNWRLQDVISYLKTGFSGITDEQCDLIEEYTSTWSVSGSLWRLDSLWGMNPNGYTEIMSTADSNLLVKVNEIRNKLREPLMRLSDSLDPKTTAVGAAEAVYRFLEETIDITTLSVQESACWNGIVSALEQLSLCGADAPIGDLESFKRLLKLISTQTDFALIPSTVDEISCTAISASGSSDIKKCYIIGGCEGCYPVVFKENELIGDEMRIALAERNLYLPFDPDEIQKDQMWMFWNRVLSADEIWVSRYTSSLDGKESLPCEAIYELKRLFPQITVQKESDFDINDLIYDKASALDRLSDPIYGADIKKLFYNDEEYKALIDSLEIPIVTGECAVLNPENLEAFSGDINLTQTRIDKFTDCKFAYQLQYVLGLREQRKVDYNPRDVGVFIHSLLEEFFAYRKELNDKGRTMSLDDATDAVNKLVDSYIERVCGDQAFITKRMSALFERLRRQSLLFVKSIIEEFENSDFEPVLFEVSITDDTNKGITPFKCKLNDNSSVFIYGQIDRVDCYVNNGKVYFRVVDYKTGDKVFRRSDLNEGKNLQMLLYMFSIMENQKKFCDMLGLKGELVPSGVLYYIARLPGVGMETVVDTDEAEQLAIESISRHGMLLGDYDSLFAMSKDQSKVAYPKGVDANSTEATSEFIYSLKGLEEIKKTISNTLVRIAKSLKNGEASADAVCGNKSACVYCRMRPICRHAKTGGGIENE